MLEVFTQILFALLIVYGIYCIIINVTYIFFRGNKDSIAVAIISNTTERIDSQFIMAKRVFSLGVPTVILVEKDADEEKIQRIKKKYPGVDIYRTDKVKDDERKRKDK